MLQELKQMNKTLKQQGESFEAKLNQIQDTQAEHERNTHAQFLITNTKLDALAAQRLYLSNK